MAEALTDRQKELIRRRRRVARLVSSGKSKTDVAKSLSISTQTVTRDLLWIKEHESERLTAKPKSKTKKTPTRKKSGAHSSVSSTRPKKTASEKIVQKDDNDTTASDVQNRRSNGSVKPPVQLQVRDDKDESEAVTESFRAIPQQSEDGFDEDESQTFSDEFKKTMNLLADTKHTSDYPDVLTWWKNDSSTPSEAAEGEKSYADATHSDLKSADREADAIDAFNAIPDEDKYVYMKHEVQAARLSVIIGGVFIGLILFMFSMLS
jgi:hypothetical protein